MTTDFKSYTDLVQQTQDNVRWAVETWTKTVQDAIDALPTTFAPLDPYDTVDRAFDFTEKVLEIQRDFAKKLIASATAQTATSAQAAKTAAAKTAKAAK